MKTTLILVGKTTSPPTEALMRDYGERLGHYMRFSLKVVPDVRNARSLSQKELKRQEGEGILRLIKPEDCVVLLDERGKERRSVDFASWINSKQLTGRDLVFVIGGAYGFPEDVYERADEMISLSQMTFSHQMVRAIFLEQLYRAATILRGEKYHHE